MRHIPPFDILATFAIQPEHRTLDSLVDETVRRTDFLLKPPDAVEVLPSIWQFVSEAAGVCCIIETPWENEKSKRVMLGALRSLVREMKIDRYSYVSEAWMTKHTSQKAAERAKRPSQDANRINTVVVVAADRAGLKKSKVFELVEHVDRRRMAAMDIQPDGLAGPMLDLFDDKASLSGQVADIIAQGERRH